MNLHSFSWWFLVSCVEFCCLINVEHFKTRPNTMNVSDIWKKWKKNFPFIINNEKKKTSGWMFALNYFFLFKKWKKIIIIIITYKVLLWMEKMLPRYPWFFFSISVDNNHGLVMCIIVKLKFTNDTQLKGKGIYIFLCTKIEFIQIFSFC